MGLKLIPLIYQHPLILKLLGRTVGIMFFLTLSVSNPYYKFDLCSVKCQPGYFSICQRNIDVDTSFVGFNMLPIVSSKFQKDVGVGAKPLFVPCLCF